MVNYAALFSNTIFVSDLLLSVWCEKGEGSLTAKGMISSQLIWESFSLVNLAATCRVFKMNLSAFRFHVKGLNKDWGKTAIPFPTRSRVEDE